MSAPVTTLLRDRRGANNIQMLVLAIVLALGGLGAVKLLAFALGGRSICAGEEIKSLGGGAAPCREAIPEQVPVAVTQPPPPAPDTNPQPADDAPADDEGEGDDEEDGGEEEENPEEIDPAEELLRIAADIIGLTDAKKCITEGDILACLMTALNFTPGKIFGLGFKLIKNANKIKNAVERFLAARKAKKAADEAAENGGAVCRNGVCDRPGVCFAPGTLVHTEGGLEPIESLEPGDLVWSRDDVTGEESYRPVVRTFVTEDQPIMSLALEDEGGTVEELEVTPPHPFNVEGRGWVQASDLVPGDLVVSSGGGELRVVDNQSSERRSTVYNFEVDEFHTYFVGESAAWVHNQCKPLPQRLKNKLKRIRNQTAAGGNRGISGAVSPDDARRLGEEFVGPGFRVGSDGKTLISADGLRQFRPPSPKRGIDPNTGQPFSRTGVQVNFESRTSPSGRFTSNVHLDVTT